jgi:hypothetical protein
VVTLEVVDGRRDLGRPDRIDRCAPFVKKQHLPLGRDGTRDANQAEDRHPLMSSDVHRERPTAPRQSGLGRGSATTSSVNDKCQS